MGKEDLASKRAELTQQRARLQKRYDELQRSLRSLGDGIEGYKAQAEMLNVDMALRRVDEEMRQVDLKLKAFQDSVYERKHESAIVTGCIALEKHIEELRATLLEGKPPESAGMAGKPLPLPREEADYARRTLDELRNEIGEIKQRFSHGLTDETPSILLTYMWSSVLLGRMEGIVESMKPKRLERTRGEMPRDYKEFLEEKIPRIERKIAELRGRYTTARPKDERL
ncbi:MAG: hypothetical protein JTT11_08870 [Candidatus Brockarchaeota archaeon]|nr:hypothetical protein [Candidatus Brockarchaeota archaeon]